MSEVPIPGRTFEWDLQTRVFNFVIGVLMPLPIFISLSWSMLLVPNSIIKIVIFVCSATIVASSVGLGSYCLFPQSGSRSWVRNCVRAGLFFWTPIAFLWCTITFMVALLASLLVAMFIKLGAKAIARLNDSGSRFTLKQIFWLTTLSALLAAVLTPFIRAVDDPMNLLFPVLAFITLSTPVLAVVTFSSVSLELQELKQGR